MMPAEEAPYASGRVDVTSSGWTHYPGKPLTFECVAGHVSTDILVVGAGLAGSSLALHLAEGGARVTLIDVHEPGWGASGRNAGHVVAHPQPVASLRKLPDAGEAFMELWRREMRLPYELAQRHGIDCDAVPGGYMQTVTAPRHLRRAEKYAEGLAGLGLPVRYADRAEVARFTGSDRFAGGVLDPASGRINPFHFTRGLADAARRAGANVFSRSGAEALDRMGSRWRVVTRQATIDADQVVLCTGAYDRQALPTYAASWYPLLAYAIATKPLPEAMRQSMLPSGGVSAGMMASDSCPFLIDGLGRLISAWLPTRPAFAPDAALRRLRRWLQRTFPQAAGVDLQLAAYWTGVTAFSPSWLPRISELGPGLLALNCFSVEGNVPAPMMGKHLAEKLLKGALGELALPLEPAPPVLWRGRYEFVMRRVLVPLHNAFGHLLT